MVTDVETRIGQLRDTLAHWRQRVERWEGREGAHRLEEEQAQADVRAWEAAVHVAEEKGLAIHPNGVLEVRLPEARAGLANAQRHLDQLAQERAEAIAAHVELKAAETAIAGLQAGVENPVRETT